MDCVTIPFKQLTENFLEEARLKKFSPATITSYWHSLNLFIQYLTANKINDIRQVTIDIINNYKKHLQRPEKKYSPWTIYIYIKAVKKLFEYLEETNQLLINPCQRLIMPRPGNRLPKNVLTREEIQKILLTPNISIHTGIRDKALLETLYSTGIRLSECTNLNVYEIDYEGGHLRVNCGKGAKDRIVPVGKIACRWLKEYLTKTRPFLMREEKVIRIKKITREDERALWIAQSGKRITPLWLNRILKQYTHKAAITKQVTVHTFRRTFATHMLAEGANPYYIQKLLGHETAGTINRYIKLIPRDIKRAHKQHHPREKEQWRKTKIHIKKYV